MKLILLIVISSSLILGMEILKRKFSLSVALTRRVIHISTAVVAATAPLFVTKQQLIFVCILFAGVLFAGRKHRLFSAIQSVERHTFGEIFLPLGIVATAFFFLPRDMLAFQFGVFIMGISDAIGGLVGERFGKRIFMIFGNKKSLEGSLAFFGCSLILTYLFYPIFGYKLFLIPLILTITEFSFIYGLDNLVLPILGAYLIHFIL